MKTAIGAPVTLLFAVNFATASLDLDIGDFDGSDKSSQPTLLKATAITGRPPSSILAELNRDTSEGRWAFRVNDAGNGTVSLVIKWRPRTGMKLVFR